VTELAARYVSIIPSFKGGARAIGRELDGPAEKAGAEGGRRYGAGMRKGLGGLGAKIFAPLAAAAAGVGIASFFTDAVAGASDLNESTTKIAAIFGTASGAVQQFAAGGADALGQTKLQVLDAAATFGTFGKAAGLAGNDLAGFSTGFAGLSTDLASFYNTSPTEAVEAIGAALRGEAEPIRKFGVLLDDATLRNEALKLGLIKTTKEALTPQQKVLAAQAAIYAQTKDAQGDFARTSGGLANQQRILSASFSDFKTTLGEKLLPVVLEIVGWLNDKFLPGLKEFAGYVQSDVIPRVAEFGGWLGKNRDWLIAAGIATATFLGVVKGFIILNAVVTALKAYRVAGLAATLAQWGFNAALLANPIVLVIAAVAALVAALVWFFTKTELGQKIIAVAWAAIKTAVKAVADWFTGTLVPGLGRVWDSIKSGVVAVGDLFGRVWQRIRDAASRTWDFIKAVFSWTPLGIIITNWDKILGFFGGIGGKIAARARGMWDGIVSAFRGAINSVIRLWNNLSFTIGGGSILGMDIPSLTLNTPNIAYLAEGGLIDRPTLAMIGEGREPEGVAPISELRKMVREGSDGGGLPGTVVLLDVDGSILARTEVIADGKLAHAQRRARGAAARRGLRSIAVGG
jgi:hypothetical protein